MSAPTFLWMSVPTVKVSEIATVREDVIRRSPANVRESNQEISNTRNIFTLD